MYKLCTTEKTALQQRQFEQAFLELSQELLYDDITISELCRRAGLSRKIFYRLFERKADVLYALIDQTILDSLLYKADPSVGKGNLHRFLAFWRDQKPLLDVLKANNASSLLTESTIRYILKEDSDLRHCLGLEQTEYGKEALLFYISGIFSLVMNWHSQDYRQSIDDLSKALMYLMTTPPVKHPLLNHPEARD